MKQKEMAVVLKSIGEALGKLREKKGFKTVKNFALQHKLPVIQYWRIERGKANLTIKSLIKILAIHRVSFEDFFCQLSA